MIMIHNNILYKSYLFIPCPNVVNEIQLADEDAMQPEAFQSSDFNFSIKSSVKRKITQQKEVNLRISQTPGDLSTFKMTKPCEA